MIVRKPILAGLLAVVVLPGCTRGFRVSEAVKELNNCDPAVRLAAAGKLGFLGEASAEPGLIRVLVDEEESVRQGAARALWLIRKESGQIQPFEWQILRLQDRLNLLPDGRVGLIREMDVQVAAAYGAVEQLAFFLPAYRPEIEFAKEVSGDTCPFDLSQVAGHPEVVLSGLRGFTAGKKKTLQLFARLDGLLHRFPSDPAQLNLVFEPGSQNVAVWSYSLEIRVPRGTQWLAEYAEQGLAPVFNRNGVLERITWEGSALSKEDQAKLQFEICVPKSAAPSVRRTLLPANTGKDLSRAGAVLLGLGLLAFFLACWCKRCLPTWYESTVILVCSLLGLVLFFEPKLLPSDLSSYCLARSPVLDGDLSLANDLFLQHAVEPVSFGLSGRRLPIGPSLLWIPFIVLGHLANAVLSTLGVYSSDQGFSLPYLLSVGLGGFFYTLASVLMCYQMGRKYCRNAAILVACLLVTFSTNLVLVFFMRTGSTFPPILFSFCLFLFCWQRILNDQAYWRWPLLGLLAGLLILNSPVLGLLGLLPLLQAISETWKSCEARNTRTALGNALSGLLYVLLLAVALSPLWVFKQATGNHIVGDLLSGLPAWTQIPRGLGDLAALLWYGNFRFAGGGLFSSSPLVIPGLIGLGLIYARDRWFGFALGLAFLFQTFGLATGRMQEGMPLYVPPLSFAVLFPVFALGLGAALNWLARVWRRIWPIWLIGIPAILWNFYCVILQVGSFQDGTYPELTPLAKGLHQTLFLSGPEFSGATVAGAGSFGFLLRAIAHGLAVTNIMEMLSGLGPLLIVLPVGLLILLFLHAVVVGDLPESSARRFVLFGAILVLGCDVGIRALGHSTDFKETRAQLMVSAPGDEALILEPSAGQEGGGASHEFRFGPEFMRGPKAHLKLLGYLRGAAPIVQGKPVVEVKITAANGSKYRARLLAGIHLADFASGSELLRPSLRHSGSQAAIATEELVRDETGAYFWGRAFECHIKLPKPILISRVQVSYLAASGKFALMDLVAFQPFSEWADINWRRVIAARPVAGASF